MDSEDFKNGYLLGKKDGLKLARKATINEIASTILTELEFGVGGNIECFLVEYFEQLKENIK